MKFSIVIPIYKVEKYLHECVDGVLNQTFTDFEIILVDDGSPDKCPQICDEYAKLHSNISVIHQKNAGIACARNTGIAAAKGEYVICIDSDDYFVDADVLSCINEKTTSNPDVIMFGYKKYFESDKSWGADVCPILDVNLSVGQTVKSMLQNGSYIATAWTKAVKLDVLRKNNIEFKPGMVSGEDVDWYLNLLCFVKKFECVEKACLAYRQRPDSISHQPKVKSIEDFLWILEEWPSKFEKRDIEEDTKNALWHAMAYYWANVLVLYSQYSSKVAKPNKERLKQVSYLSKYAITSRALTMKKFYNLLGFDMTILLLKVLGKIKKRQ